MCECVRALTFASIQLDRIHREFKVPNLEAYDTAEPAPPDGGVSCLKSARACAHTSVNTQMDVHVHTHIHTRIRTHSPKQGRNTHRYTCGSAIGTLTVTRLRTVLLLVAFDHLLLPPPLLLLSKSSVHDWQLLKFASREHPTWLDPGADAEEENAAKQIR